jgi:hypothetical protein
MKKALIALAAMLMSVAAYGQAQVVFNTRVVGSVDAPVFKPGNVLPGPGFTAQLFWDNAGSLVPLTPATTFRTVATREQYVEPVDVTINGLAAGAQGTFIFRAWETAGGSFDQAKAAHWWGESAPVTIATGGGLNPPANLVGLQGFTLQIVPEPSTIALGVLGAAALLLRRRK